MQIAYFGNYLGHGETLSEWGTGLSILLSLSNDVEKIDVYCPLGSEVDRPSHSPGKITIIESFNPDKPASILNVISHLKKEPYDIILFNLVPTTFGNRSVGNILALLLPALVKRYVRGRIFLIYHNSGITNDPVKLGYTSIYDRIRRRLLILMESCLFKKVDTLLLLDYYKKIIDRKVESNKTKLLESNYIEAIPTLYLNNKINEKSLIVHSKNNIPRVLLYGYWGPQKNPELALNSLEKARQGGIDFNLIVGGSINPHFPAYKKYYQDVIKKHEPIIDEIKGYIKEEDLLDLFLGTDLILLPYNHPGGQSGVMEMASLFGVHVIALEFPEYKEKSERRNNVELCSTEDFMSCVKLFLERFSGDTERTIDLSNKLNHSLNKIISILECPNENITDQS